MDRFQPSSAVMLFIIMSSLLLTGAKSATFTLVNQCNYTVWPGVLTGAGIAQLAATGFVLSSGNTTVFTAPSSWSGRIWGRTLCSVNATTNAFSCLTADCGTGAVACNGNGAEPPATLVELTLGGYGGADFYDVSLVDGYNLPMSVTPVDGTGNCSAVTCDADLNASCPDALRVEIGGESVACKSACDAFGDPQNCCSGSYASPSACKPTSYSEFFKSQCPDAYSYAFDDASSIFTCSGADFLITFCATEATTAKKSTPPTNNTTSSGSLQITSTAPMHFSAALTALLTSLGWLIHQLFFCSLDH
ncbi:hypothetical protein Droror1_Dr00010942 [Drosera rotundifolia]